jgi:hypothetical protein
VGRTTNGGVDSRVYMAYDHCKPRSVSQMGYLLSKVDKDGSNCLDGGEFINVRNSQRLAAKSAPRP